MPTATLIDRDNLTFAGPANCYHLDPPLMGNEFVMVYIEPGYGSITPRVTIVPKRIGDAPALNAPLPGSYSLQHDVSIDDGAWFALLAAGGYEIVVPDPVVDDSPAEFDEPTTLEPLALENAEPEVAEVIRVHELAKELGITSAELLAKLAEYGSTITNASANVDHDTAQIMRGIYAEGES